MKNIQVIDGAINCVYDIFAATDEEFSLIFPNDTNIAFSDEIFERAKRKRQSKKLLTVMENLWKRPVRKSEANGIHGIIFYQLEIKKQFYPTRKDEEAVNPAVNPGSPDLKIR